MIAPGRQQWARTLQGTTARGNRRRSLGMAAPLRACCEPAK